MSFQIENLKRSTDINVIYLLILIKLYGLQGVQANSCFLEKFLLLGTKKIQNALHAKKALTVYLTLSALFVTILGYFSITCSHRWLMQLRVILLFSLSTLLFIHNFCSPILCLVSSSLVRHDLFVSLASFQLQLLLLTALISWHFPK